jgi:Phage integrase SAM-like domain
MQSQPNGDHRQMVKTRTPGIYKRGSRYVVVYRANGRQRKESARTLEEARRLKSRRQADVDANEFFEASRRRFGEYAREWVERYRGRGRRGFRESTREGYRALLEQYAIPFFDGHFDQRQARTLSAITPRDVANFVHWVSQQPARNGRPLSDNTIRTALNRVRACLATAVTEGLIRHNPTSVTPGGSHPHTRAA